MFGSLGVTVTNTLSVHEHVSNVISSCSQSVHALRILRTHGMTAALVHIIFKSVVVAKLVYTPQAHGGASRRPTTENDYKLSFAVASVLTSVNSTTELSKN